MLSGYRPYLSPEAEHPNPILHRKLKEARHLSIVDQVILASLVFSELLIAPNYAKHFSSYLGKSQSWGFGLQNTHSNAFNKPHMAGGCAHRPVEIPPAGSADKLAGCVTGWRYNSSRIIENWLKREEHMGRGLWTCVLVVYFGGRWTIGLRGWSLAASEYTWILFPIALLSTEDYCLQLCVTQMAGADSRRPIQVTGFLQGLGDICIHTWRIALRLALQDARRAL